MSLVIIFEGCHFLGIYSWILGVIVPSYCSRSPSACNTSRECLRFVSSAYANSSGHWKCNRVVFSGRDAIGVSLVEIIKVWWMMWAQWVGTAAPRLLQWQVARGEPSLLRRPTKTPWITPLPLAGKSLSLYNHNYISESCLDLDIAEVYVED